MGYWLSTAAVSLSMAYSDLVYLRYAPATQVQMFPLSYSGMFIILGLLQVLGSAVLLAPRWPRLKRWAYGTFALLFCGQTFSALAWGEQRDALASLIALGLLGISFFLRHVLDRR